MCISNLCNFQNPRQGREDTFQADCVSVFLAVRRQQQPLFPLPVHLLLQIAIQSPPKPLSLVWDHKNFSHGGRSRFQTVGEIAGLCSDTPTSQTWFKGACNPSCPRAGVGEDTVANKPLPFSPPAWLGAQNHHAELGRRQQMRRLWPHGLPCRGGAVRREELPPVLLPLQ